MCCTFIYIAGVKRNSNLSGLFIVLVMAVGTDFVKYQPSLSNSFSSSTALICIPPYAPIMRIIRMKSQAFFYILKFDYLGMLWYADSIKTREKEK